MAITTRRVTGPIVLPDGSAPLNCRVTLALSGPDAEGATRIVEGPIAVWALDGTFDADLWCTDTGDAGRVYVGAVSWHDGKTTQSRALVLDVPSGAGDLPFVPVWSGSVPESTQADALAQCLAAAASAALDRVATGEDRAAAEDARGEAEAARDAAVAAAEFRAPSMADFLARSDVTLVGARWRVDTGEVLDVVASGTGDYDHPVSGRSLAAVPMGGWYITPEMLGAAGDGSADDIEAVEAAIRVSHEHRVECIMPGTYSVSRPVHITPSLSRAKLRGVRPMGENVQSPSAIVARSGFAGSDVLLVGDPDGLVSLNGGTVDGIRVDASLGNGANAVRVVRTEYTRLTDVYAHNATGTGRGLVMDGVWFPYLDRVTSRYNNGGGVLLSSTSRESSDGVATRLVSNTNSGWALEFDRRWSQDRRQAKWKFFGGEIGGKMDAAASTQSEGVLRMRGADKCQFFGTSFMESEMDPSGHMLMLFGEDDYAPAGSGIASVEAVQFFGCDTQWTHSGGAMRFADGGVPLSSMSFIGGVFRSLGMHLDLSNVTAGTVDIYGVAGLAPSQINDPNRRVRTVPGGAAGLRYGAAPDQFYVECLDHGVPVNVVWRDAAGGAHLVRYGEGSSRNMVAIPGGVAQRFAPTSSPPSAMLKGSMLFADGDNWDPLGMGPATGGYFVWWNGAKYLPLNKTSSEIIIS